MAKRNIKDATLQMEGLCAESFIVLGNMYTTAGLWSNQGFGDSALMIGTAGLSSRGNYILDIAANVNVIGTLTHQ